MARRKKAPIVSRPEVPFSVLQGLLDEFESAARQDEVKGTQHPLEMESRSRNYNAARENIENAIRKLSREQWEIS